jgi:hypothetical protein
MGNSKYIEELKKQTIRNDYGTYKYGDYVIAHCFDNGRWINIYGTITDVCALSEWNGFVTLGYGSDRFYVDFRTLRPYEKKAV